MSDEICPDVLTGTPAELPNPEIHPPNLADITARLERIETTLTWLLAAIVDKREI